MKWNSIERKFSSSRRKDFSSFFNSLEENEKESFDDQWIEVEHRNPDRSIENGDFGEARRVWKVFGPGDYWDQIRLSSSQISINFPQIRSRLDVLQLSMTITDLTFDEQFQ